MVGFREYWLVENENSVEFGGAMGKVWVLKLCLKIGSLTVEKYSKNFLLSFSSRAISELLLENLSLYKISRHKHYQYLLSNPQSFLFFPDYELWILW